MRISGRIEQGSYLHLVTHIAQSFQINRYGLVVTHPAVVFYNSRMQECNVVFDG